MALVGPRRNHENGVAAKAIFTPVPRRWILGTSPPAQALEGKHPVCFRSELRHISGHCPPAVERGQALLVLGGPTGYRAPLSDVDGNLVFFQLAEQFSGGRYAHALQALHVVFDHQVGSIPGEDHRDLLPDLDGAVGRYVQRHGGQGRVFHPLGDYVEQPHLVLLLSEPFRPSGAYLSTTIMMPPSEVWCTGRRSIQPSARTENSAKLIPAGGWPATTQAATARSAGEHAALLPGRILRPPQA